VKYYAEYYDLRIDGGKLEYPSPEEILELPKSQSPTDAGKPILRGLPVRRLKVFQRITAATEEELSYILWMSSRTLETRLRAGRLAPAESDRLYRAARVIGEALFHFKNDEKRVQVWLRSPASKDHDVLPIALLGTFGGVELASHYLERAYFETYLWEKTKKEKANEKALYRFYDPLAILSLERSKDIDREIRNGFPYRSYELFRKRTLFSVTEMKKILWVASSTLSKFHSRGRLSGDASDRLYRAAVVYYFVNTMVSYRTEDTQDWLHERSPSLGGCRPIDLMRTEPGVQAVIATACRVLDGMGA
jgi:putative toxin-antitoxin system antitoxin component (TIGR02293 family)